MLTPAPVMLQSDERRRPEAGRSRTPSTGGGLAARLPELGDAPSHGALAPHFQASATSPLVGRRRHRGRRRGTGAGRPTPAGAVRRRESDAVAAQLVPAIRSSAPARWLASAFLAARARAKIEDRPECGLRVTAPTALAGPGSWAQHRDGVVDSRLGIDREEYPSASAAPEKACG